MSLVVAVDGPAGSGKSTVARAVAARLGLEYLDTGAMYRAVAQAALAAGVSTEEQPEQVARIAKKVELAVGERVMVDGSDVTAEIRSPEVTKAVTAAAANPEVRREMVERQRAWVDQRGGGVVEGRDIGTVVFPDARVKVYLTADAAERARRRAAEAGEAVATDIERRDRADAGRAHSPMAAAEDAVTIDTTHRTVEDVVEEIMGLVAQRQLPGKGW